MTSIDLEAFGRETQCIYRGEEYLVRDNGAVLRRRRARKRRRPLDDKWTFGKACADSGYMMVSAHRVHQIVATAFHGPAKGSGYVVDHIDTNRRNNRPENLRWVTRLDNALQNPVTRKKIEYLCGSIERFLANPSMLNDLQGDPSFGWMRTVTKEEAENCRKRMLLWANAEEEPGRNRGPIHYERGFSDRAFKPLHRSEAGLAGEPGLEFASTPWCGKYMWPANVQFPCCPQEFGPDPVVDYIQSLQVDAVFASCDTDGLNGRHAHPDMLVDAWSVLEGGSSFVVMCSRPDSKWSLVGVKLNDRSHFIHFHLGSYGTLGEAERAMPTKRVEDFWKDAYAGAREAF